jgi:hypothetical protein
MAQYLNVDSPRKVVVEAAMQGQEFVRAEHLRSCAPTDADFIAGLRAAQDYGMEVRGYVPHHLWMEFLNGQERRIMGGLR